MPYKTVIVHINDGSSSESKNPLNEIKGLAETAGLEILYTLTQNIKRKNPATYIGTGKVKELKEVIEITCANLVVFDCELTPSQQNNLEKFLNTQILDRTALILYIFARRARTREGKIQVELAQLTYILSRLKGKGITLSRLAGGIGIRGPGETKLETDRRKINNRITRLKKELGSIEKSRNLHRQLRAKRNIPQIVIVGYTNSGKSTLINCLSSANIFVEDKLFATLDPTTRKLRLSNEKQVIITDTVGFIEKLPHHLVKAFRSTFEEIKEADLILNIIDIADSNFHNQTNIVKEVLASMEVDNIPTIYIYNKIDICNISKETFLRHPKQMPFVMMSAKNGEGVDELLRKIEQKLSDFWVRLSFKIDYMDSSLLSLLLSTGYVLKQENKENHTLIEVELPKHLAEKLKKLYCH